MSHTVVNNQNTKMQLADSLKKLMTWKPLNKISIREITDDSGVNRQTFYYHFQDIFDLLEWLYRKEASQFLEEHKMPFSLNDGILHILQYIQENEAFCRCTLNSLGHSHLKQFFYNGINSVLMALVNEYSEDLNVDEEHKRFIAHFYTVSFSGFIENWLQEGLKGEPEDMIQLCEVTMQGNIRGALERFSK